MRRVIFVLIGLACEVHGDSVQGSPVQRDPHSSSQQLQDADEVSSQLTGQVSADGVQIPVQELSQRFPASKFMAFTPSVAVKPSLLRGRYTTNHPSLPNLHPVAGGGGSIGHYMPQVALVQPKATSQMTQASITNPVEGVATSIGLAVSAALTAVVGIVVLTKWFLRLQGKSATMLSGSQLADVPRRAGPVGMSVDGARGLVPEDSQTKVLKQVATESGDGLPPQSNFEVYEPKAPWNLSGRPQPDLCMLSCDAFPFSAIKPRVQSRATVYLNESNGLSASDIELLDYWKKHSAMWATPLRIFDVQTAYNCGELDGVMPSGALSRAATSERLISLGKAIELFEKDKLQVRRRFRNLTPIELAPRWDRVLATRARLQAAGKWDEIVRESDKTSAFERAKITGETEDADASPLASRIVATILSPALKAAANQRSRENGGLFLAIAQLQTASDDPAERWLTSMLLAEFEGEINELSRSKKPVAKSPSFAETEAQRDVEEANQLGLVGVGAALVLGSSLLASMSGGNDADSMMRGLDIMQ